jgi:bifunctional DNA-binding transcriptional regulator/antitoxin component of YhaV-PrlF toxin-antitoxin module
MSKVTSKLQVTIPKRLAERHRIRPGDEIQWASAGDSIRIEIGSPTRALSTEARLKLFDESVKRQKRRQAGKRYPKNPSDRGWKREDLYERGRPR